VTEPKRERYWYLKGLSADVDKILPEGYETRIEFRSDVVCVVKAGDSFQRHGRIRISYPKWAPWPEALMPKVETEKPEDTNLLGLIAAIRDLADKHDPRPSNKKKEETA
jgi:hypothetical protein